MKQAVPGLIAAVVLLVIAFLPPVVEAAARNENVHFGEHLLVLLAGILLAYAARFILRDHLALGSRRVPWGDSIAALGLILFLASQVPAVDALADTTMAIHLLQHLVILVSGGLMGTGLLLIAFGATPKASPHPR